MNKLSYIPKLSIIDLVFLFTSSILTTLLGLVLPFAILIIFDRVLPNQATSTLYFIYSIILIAIILDYKVKALEETLIADIGNKFERKITNQLFQAVCHANITRFKKLEVGEYLERLNTIPSLKSYFSGDLVSSFINIFTCIVTIVVLAVINLNTGIIISVASLFLFIIANFSTSKKVQLLETKSTIEGITNSKIIEIVSYPLDIKSRTMEYRVENLMNNMIEQREHFSTKFERQESNFALILSLVQQLSVAVVVINGALSVIATEMSQGVMAAIILLTNRYFGPYQQAMRTMGQWKINKIYIDRLNEMLLMENTNKAACTSSESAAEPEPSARSDSSVLASDKANEALLAYNGRIPKIIFNNREISFTKGKITLLKGKSGSGKTRLIERIVQKSQEDNIDANLVVTIDKNSSFIEGTIIDNITCFRPQLHKAAYSLCEALSIKEDIDQLKLGFFTELSSGDSKVFSRQVSFLLLIVRALLNNKLVIIIDDFDLVYDQEVAINLLSCLRPRTGKYSFVIVSNKITNTDTMVETITLG
ncbi:ABC transporter transmembrane domain-containing protein [Shewanella sp. UCD-KL21]|uniref:ABC transporter transmembrane domain-containing protein n=1 Tax=Shewanella sp. UCD-KL21 TaxID=1917164 RepID=UPI001C37AA55|nr:ABC transporter transmembrane domain-containing protein [Shewanella sp. UCD-KL21]